jgi:hypothetical protein
MRSNPIPFVGPEGAQRALQLTLDVNDPGGDPRDREAPRRRSQGRVSEEEAVLPVRGSPMKRLALPSKSSPRGSTTSWPSVSKEGRSPRGSRAAAPRTLRTRRDSAEMTVSMSSSGSSGAVSRATDGSRSPKLARVPAPLLCRLGPSPAAVRSSARGTCLDDGIAGRGCPSIRSLNGRKEEVHRRDGGLSEGSTASGAEEGRPPRFRHLDPSAPATAHLSGEEGGASRRRGAEGQKQAWRAAMALSWREYARILAAAVCAQKWSRTSTGSERSWAVVRTLSDGAPSNSAEQGQPREDRLS